MTTPQAASADRTHARFWTEPAAALALCLVVVLWQTLRPAYTRPIADALQYARIALDLVDAWRAPDKSWLDTFGLYFGPGYPGFLSLFSLVDPGLESTLRCVVDPKAVCDLGGLTPLFIIQGLLAAVSAWVIFLAARRLTADRRVAWIALLLVLGTKVNAHYGALVLTEALAFPFFFLFLWQFAEVLTAKGGPPCKAATVCGLALAAAVLVRPSYTFLVEFMVLVLVAQAWTRRDRGLAVALAPTIAFVLGVALLLGPWVLRNYLVLGVAAVSQGAGDKVLIERLPYNLMTWKEWAVSFVYWLPDFGDNLARVLFNHADYARLGWYEPETFYSMGRGRFFLDLRQASGQSGHPLAYLVKNYVLNDLGKHVAVTFALAWRGMWVGKYLGLVGFVLSPVCFRRLARSGRALPFAFFCLPGFFMLGLYAFVTVNVVRYNEPLIAVFAVSVAVALVALAERVRDRFVTRKEMP